jgi:rubrerythrin
MLQWAHGVEIGASMAYRGHAENVKDRFENTMIRLILSDEAWHRIDLKYMLDELGAKPNKVFDALFWCIGKTISGGCYVMGYRMAMWGAKIMEVMGSQIYWKLAIEATNSGHQQFHRKLCNMARQEEKHEEFFKTCLAQRAAQSQQSQS